MMGGFVPGKEMLQDLARIGGGAPVADVPELFEQLDALGIDRNSPFPIPDLVRVMYQQSIEINALRRRIMRIEKALDKAQMMPPAEPEPTGGGAA